MKVYYKPRNRLKGTTGEHLSVEALLLRLISPTDSRKKDVNE